jgi:predicted dinucleotide-binding enzyme
MLPTPSCTTLSIHRVYQMKIGILGAGNIGKTLVQRLSAAGHDVKVANSRGPATISPDVVSCGGRAVTADEAIVDVDVVITSTPFMSILRMRPLLASLPDEVTVIDTSNYYPHRGDMINEIDNGQAESAWVAGHIGRPIAKAWNTIITASFDANAKPAGTAGRIALPVAADRARDLKVAMALVEETGFDAVDAGKLEESWRQQPGAPCYCTDLSREELPAALATTEKSRLAKRRELMIAVTQERFGAGINGRIEPAVRIMRALFL